MIHSFNAQATALLSHTDALAPLLSHDTVYLNHGGLGGPPRAILQLRRLAEDSCEQQPMQWCRTLAPALVAQSRAAVKDYLSMGDGDLSFVGNASVALFSVLEAVHLAEGDMVVVTECVYHSIGDALRHMCSLAEASLHVIPLLPAGSGGVVRSEEQILAAFVAGLDEAERSMEGVVEKGRRVGEEGGGGGTTPGIQPRIKLALIDHISSKPSLIFPVKAMCEVSLGEKRTTRRDPSPYYPFET